MTEVLEPAPLLRQPCLMTGQVHRTWTLSAGVPLCLRRAVEREAGDDDMLQHDMVVGLYEQLRLLGHGDAY